MGPNGAQANERAHDPFAPLASPARATSRVQLATSVAIARPRSPMVTAAIAWDLHRHSAGRFELGLGNGVRARNERRFSVPWGAPAARQRASSSWRGSSARNEQNTWPPMAASEQ